MNPESIARLALHLIPGIGSQLVKQLVSYCGAAESVFKTPKGKLLKIPGIGEVTAEAIRRQQPLKEAEQEWLKTEKEGGKIIFFNDADFPKRLRQAYDAPALLYCKGESQFNRKKCVAIVGSRRATRYGKERVEEMVRDLAGHDPLIISGLAYGIDIQAHRAALDQNLSTVAVMASGIDIIYPASHRATALEMTESGGALVSENHLGTQPDAPKFPARNRIIAGMADALIVVEAASRGGALITAEFANDYNRDVFAVPGKVNDTLSEGCNNLIKSNKAHLITSVGDMEYIMRWEKEKADKKAHTWEELESLDSYETTVVKMLQEKGEPILIDELSWQSQINVSQLASLLLNLEFKGIVKSLPGKMFELVRF